MPCTARLAWSLLLALVLHAIALNFLRFPAIPAAAGRKATLEIVLPAAQTLSSDIRGTRQGAPITGMVAPAPRRTESPPLSDESEQPAPAPLRESQPAPSAAQLLESARLIIREEAKNPEPGATRRSGNPADNTVEAKLAKVLRTPGAGEKWLDGGIVKITTIFGTTYCLKTPPDRLRDGPVEAVSIPMNCP